MIDKELIPTIPEGVLTNLLGPTADYLGKGFGGIFNFVTLPFRLLGTVSDEVMENLETRIKDRAKKIPSENRDDSKLGLSLKALQDSIFQLNEEELREAFANLISKTLDDRVNKTISPRYSTILAELTPEDCQLLKTIYFEPDHRIVYSSMLVLFDNGIKNNGAQNLLISDKTDVHIEYNHILDTLKSLGLIEKFEEQKLTSEPFNSYIEDFLNSNFIQEYTLDIQKQRPHEKFNVFPELGYFKLTTFGEDLCDIIMVPIH